MKATNCNNPSCGKELIHTEGRRPKKYCDASCRNAHYKVKYEKRGKGAVAGTISLPKDFINVEKIAIIRANGTIEELKTPDQLPEQFQLAMRGLLELQQDINIDSRTNSGLVVDFVHIPDNPITLIPPMPVKGKDESSIDFAARKNEWKIKYSL